MSKRCHGRRDIDLRVSKPPTLRTPRLVLRPWRDDDLEPFAALNADGEVMKHFPAALAKNESDALVSRLKEHFDRHGFGLWAMEVPGLAPFIGFVGLNVPSYEAPFMPAVEIGWRIAREHWGRGFATEGARAALQFGFETLGLEEIVAMTTPANVRSLRVMKKLGMHRAESDDFDHPKVPDGHPLKRHVLYRLGRDEWKRGYRLSPAAQPVLDHPEER